VAIIVRPHAEQRFFAILRRGSEHARATCGRRLPHRELSLQGRNKSVGEVGFAGCGAGERAAAAQRRLEGRGGHRWFTRPIPSSVGWLPSEPA